MIMRRIFLILTVILSSVTIASAQTMDVELKVTDDKGRPVGDVLVEFDELQEPVFTGSDGIAKFSIEESKYVELSVHNAFYKRVFIDSPQTTVILGERSRLHGLGYNKTITGETSSYAVDGISATELSASPNTQILNALYGAIAGLQVYQNGSTAWPEDCTPILNVRGRGSYSGNQVLVLVDGVERDAASVDVAEVESVTVLKDAAALALHGMKGADGVVMITTKRGGNHKFNISAGYAFGVDTPFRVPQMASPVEYAEAYNEARMNDGLPAYFSQEMINAVAGGQESIAKSVDWKNHIMKDFGFNNDVHMTLDGSSRMARYFVYADYSSSRGFYKNTEVISGINTQAAYDALKLRTNLDLTITPTTTAIVNLSARIQQKSEPLNGTSLEKMYHAPSLGFPVMYDDIWCRSALIENPVYHILGSGNNTVFARKLSADLALRQRLDVLTEGLSAEIKIAYDNAAFITDGKGFNSTYYVFSPYFGADNTLNDYNLTIYGNDTEMNFSSYLASQYMHMNVWAKLDYTRSFGKHNLSSQISFKRESHTLAEANMSYVNHDLILGATYDYDGRYLAALTLDYAGSSRMPSGDKYRLFPAASLGWVISNEEFLKNSDVVNFLKLRAGYGIVGMDRYLSYDMDKQFNGAGNSFIFVSPGVQVGMTEGTLPSVGINPETDHRADVGLEFAFFKYLSGEISAFRNERRYLRTSPANTVSSILGVGIGDTFEGATLNRGVEIALGWSQAINDISYRIKGNVSYAKNRITSMSEEFKPGTYMYMQGNSIERFYGLVSDGYYGVEDFDENGKLYQDVVSSTFADVQPGDVKYKDQNGDNKIDNYDYTYQLYSTTPEIYYGIQIGLDWKGLGFNAWFQGAGRSTVVTDLASIYQPLYGGDKNVSRHYLANRWTPENPQARYPRLTTLENKNNFLASDLWTESGDFFKLREFELYYRLPQQWLSRIKMDEVKITFRGHNLFCIDKVGLMDPEHISFAYPVVRTFTVGLNVTF